jgi:hypothetical protein
MPAQVVPAGEGGAPSWRTGWMLGWLWSPKGSAATAGGENKARSEDELNTLLDCVDREERGAANQDDEVLAKKIDAEKDLHAAGEQPPTLEECGDLQLKRTASLGSQDSKDDDAWTRKTQSPWRLSVAGSKKFACSRQARKTISPLLTALAAHDGGCIVKQTGASNPFRSLAESLPRT